ncbi:hypothetical protein [Massilia sp. Root335]|uniref:hypothetical protein n=1 Tax=Massilia sp. Root335 TaxID=1736517 RepID=UPI000B0E8203|nr:hypothetical protein [Massilia sp. Root335]
MQTKLMSLLMLVLLGGCSTAYDTSHPYEGNWRIGQVEEVGSATAAFPITGFDCRRDAAGVPNSGNVRYAYVRFEFSGGTKYMNSIPKQRHVIVTIPDDLNAQEGEWVYVNIRDCSQPMARLKPAR